MKKWKRLTVWLFLLFGFMLVSVQTAFAKELTERLQTEIAQKYKELYNTDLPEYTSQPILTPPYAPGTLTDDTLQKALNMVNLVRYVAGFDANVKLDAEYINRAQTGALVLAAINELTHYPAQPVGMSDEMYQIGAGATSSSNLAMGYGSLSSSILGYMDDTDYHNIDRVGHRRWLLNPAMGKIGFGMVGRYSDTYVFDWSGKTVYTYDAICWPASQMPVEMFYGYEAWSVNLGDKFGTPDLNAVSVTLTRTRDGQTWTFDKNTRDLGGRYFNVDNAGYGIPKCIIFRPENLTIEEGDVYQVTIQGLTDSYGNPASYSYKTTFFSVDNPAKMKPSIARASVSKISDQTYTGKAKKPGIKVTDDGKKLVLGEDYTVSYNNHICVGTGTITIKGIGNYTGTKTVTFKINPTKVSGFKQKEAYEEAITLSWKKRSGNYTYEIYRYYSGKYRKIGATTGTSYRDKDAMLVSGKTYKYKIRCYREIKGVKYYSACTSPVSASTRPAQMSFNYTYRNKNTVILQWYKIRGAKGYEIYCKKSYRGSYKKVYTTASGSTNKKTLWVSVKDPALYYKIRPFRVVNGVKYYGYFSKEYKVVEMK